MKRALGAIVAALALAACAEAPPPLDVAVSGCAAVRADAVCEIPDGGAIRVSVRTSGAARVSVQVGAHVERVAPDGSTEHAVKVAAGEQTRSLVVSVDEGGVPATFRLALAPRRAARTVETLCARARSGGAPDDLAELDRRSRDADPIARLTALRCLGRLARGRGDMAGAERHLDAAMRLARAEGRLSEEVDDHLLLANVHLLARRSFAGARADIAEARALTGPYAVGAARVAYYEALLAREAGDIRGALAWFDEAIDRAARLGLDELRADALAASADPLLHTGRYADALARVREALAALPPGSHACQVASKLNDEGWALLRTPPSERAGEEDPTIALQQALELARSAGCGAAFVANTLTNLALASAERGAWEEARDLIARARIADPGANVRTAYSWIQIEAASLLARGAPGEALARYDELGEVASLYGLPAVAIEASIGRGVALAALRRGEEADRAFDDAEHAVQRALHQVPLGGGRDTFAAMHERTTAWHVDFLLRRAGSERTAEARDGGAWSAEVLTGPHVERAAQVAVRSIGRALAALQSAERIAGLPADARAAREREIQEYLAARNDLDERIARARLAPLDRRGADERAIAREARALLVDLDHALAAPDSERDDDLARPGPSGESSARGAVHAAARDREPTLTAAEADDVTLVFFPFTDRWIGFAVTRGRAEARWLGGLPDALRGGELAPGSIDAAKLARVLLEPFREVIEGAARVRVIAHGPLARVPFHALPWDGAALLDHASVTYGIGLPTRPSAPAPRDRALVLGDTSFPGAAREADEAARALSRGGFVVERLEGDRALAPAVRAALARADVALAHFAGHASHGGADGLEGALLLERGTALTVADILALPRVPPLVVLSACDTGAVSAEARAAGLGLAQAFIVAGARVAVASTDRVDDGAAARLGARLYGGATFDAAHPDLVTALRDAQRAERDAPVKGAPVVWHLFRAIVP